MKRLFSKFLLCAGMLGSVSAFAGNYWQQVSPSRAPQKLQVMHPANFLVYTVDEATMKLQMWNLSEDPNEGMVVSLPMPDGSYRDFKVWQTPMMPSSLSAKYPEIRTFTGEALSNHMVTAKLDFTNYGFHAMIYDGDNTSFIDPYDNFHDGFYMVHYKKDETRVLGERMHCEVKGDNDELPGGTAMVTAETQLPKLAHKTINGYNLRTYRMAISCSHQYAQAATGLSSPTIAETFAKMTTTMNRVNGVYNREFSVQMNFVANEDTLIWPTVTGSVNGTDPFDAINSNGTSCLSQNQTTVTARIGTANFDCGHVFTTGGGGISALGVVCNATQKARSVTGLPSPVGDGYDIDYVAHEMGHEFGSNHTFNDNTNGSCSGNAVSNSAYEPGSGATIMDYAGICTPDNLQAHSDAYFSTSSLIQIQSKLAGSENVCAVATPTGNLTAGLSAFTATYTIPYKTPFELTGPAAVDSAGDTAITYDWTQWNRGKTTTPNKEFGVPLASTFLTGPIFRSYLPEYDPTRVFPKLSMILVDTLVNLPVEKGEKAPDTTRYLTFKMTVRTILNGNGCFVVPDDSVHLDVVSTGSAGGYKGFKVTSQDTAGVVYAGGTTQTVTWNVVGTDVAPVSAATVDIYMSTDGGVTWPYSLGNYPNNGSADVLLPNPATTTSAARFKVKGSGNVFFHVNKKNMTVTNNLSAGVGGPQVADVLKSIKVYPVPATDVLHIATGGSNNVNATIYNTVGQTVWTGRLSGTTDVAVATWAKGIYYARFTDAVSGTQVIKSFVIN